MASKYYVYVQLRPDNTPFYVGKGQKCRYKDIDSYSRSKYYLRTVEKYGVANIRSLIFEALSERNAFEIEMEFIQILKRLGHRLVNLTEGGEGISGYRFTKRQRRKLKARPKEHLYGPHSEETRRRIGITKKGNKNFLGRKHTALTKQKISKARAGRKISENHKKSISEKLRGSKRTEEQKNNISRSLLGHMVTEETAKKISLSNKGRSAHNKGKKAILENGKVRYT